MFKTTILLAVGFAAASANFLEEIRDLQATSATAISGTCTFGTAESC